MDASAVSQWILVTPLLAGLGYCAWKLRRTRSLRLGSAAALLLSLAFLQLSSAPAPVGDLGGLLLGGQLTPIAARFAVHLLAVLIAVHLARSLHERDRAEEVQWESMEAVRELGAFFSLERGHFHVRLGQLLALGCRKLDLEVGLVSRIEGDRYEVLCIRAPAEFGLAQGDHIELARTLCRDTIRTTNVLAVESPARHRQRESGPEPLGYQSYLGIVLRVDGELFGTLSFGSTRPRGRRFAGVEKQLLELMAHWVETELSRARQEQSKRRVAPRSDDIDRRRVEVNEALQQLEAAMRKALPENELRLQLGRLDRPARIYRYEFDRVLWSLLLHAASSSANGSTLCLSTGAVAPPEEVPTAEAFLTLEFRATGPGLDAAARSELFGSATDSGGHRPSTPASNVRPAVEGLLSLSRVRRLLEDAGGDLSVHSESGLETIFTAWLPTASESEPARVAGDVPGAG